MRHLGDVIRARRKAQRWSLGQLASRSGVDKGTLSRLESGVQYSVYPGNMARIAQAFGVSVQELEGDVGLDSGPGNECTLEEWLRRDGNLDDGQREALLMHYRSYLRR